VAWTKDDGFRFALHILRASLERPTVSEHDKTKISEIRLRDPLSNVTRRERRTLLGASALGIVIVKSGLVPTKVTALGIEFSRTDQHALLLSLGAVVGYFVVAFAMYAASDFVAWRVAFHSILGDWRRDVSRESMEVPNDEDRVLQKFVATTHMWQFSSQIISFLRAVFDFAVPLIIGIYGTILLLTASPPQ
jgi:hypothetical protein